MKLLMMESNIRSSAYPSVLTNSVVYHSWNGTNATVCMSLENQPKGGPIWSHQHPLLHGSLQVLMLQIILFNAVYLAVHFALRPFKQTKFISSVLVFISITSVTHKEIYIYIRNYIMLFFILGWHYIEAYHG